MCLMWPVFTLKNCENTQNVYHLSLSLLLVSSSLLIVNIPGSHIFLDSDEC